MVPVVPSLAVPLIPQTEGLGSRKVGGEDCAAAECYTHRSEGGRGEKKGVCVVWVLQPLLGRRLS